MRDQPTPEQTPERIDVMTLVASWEGKMRGHGVWLDAQTLGSKMVEALKYLDAQVAALTATLAHLTQENDRLFDLVRYQRAELLDAGLISAQEYASLLQDGGVNGRGSVARLETYDALRQRAEQAEATLARLTQEIKERERQRDEAENEIWTTVLVATQRAWSEPQSYGNCPTELIARLIDERDEARGCPHGQDCACAVGSRHLWMESSSKQRKRAEQAEATLARVKAQTEWQPIETAPKDGTNIILGWPKMVLGGYWADWRGPKGWVTPRGVYAGEHSPTHWMPLPVSPQWDAALVDPPVSSSTTEKT